MAILDYPAEIWLEALAMTPDQIPEALILEGTWWREQATENRLARLSNVSELAFPDMFIGQWNGHNVAYCCAYGAARAVEPAHIFAQMGTSLIIQIGTCGALDPAFSTGLVVLPETALSRDGLAASYGLPVETSADQQILALAETGLAELGIACSRTRHLTWTSLFAQSDSLCEQWAREGLQSVDMETAAVFAVAQKFGSRAVALLSVWDRLRAGHSFLDPLDSAASARLEEANRQVFEIALGLVDQASAKQAA